MISFYESHRTQATQLRLRGKTYGEIQRILGAEIPKSTLSVWFNKLHLSKQQQERVQRLVKKKIVQNQIKAVAVNREKRIVYLEGVRNNVLVLRNYIKQKEVAKIALAMLYLGEGSKTRHGSLMFGNSSSSIITLFLALLRYCYDVDESKFRCTVQCRADQDIPELERFWSHTANIPLTQFYGARVDPRTIGKLSKNKEYKGVCRIDYFSGFVYTELMTIPTVLQGNIFI